MKNLHSDWANIDNKALVRTFSFSGFLKTMSFVNAVAWQANRQMHHPEMQITYNSCTISITTHDNDNQVTNLDYKLALAIDQLAI